MRSSRTQPRSRSSGFCCGQVKETLAHPSESIHRLERDSIANRLGISLILERLELPPITEEQIDEVLDER